MENLLLFGLCSIPLILISWRTILNPASHGFYRFLSWECILWLFLNNYRFWFYNPLSVWQILSWIFLFISVYMVIAGVILLKKSGKPSDKRDERTLYAFEKTSVLIDFGIFKYIRHPLYASLLFLTWGIYLKNITASLLLISVISTILLYITALLDEKECLLFFGDSYKEYMKKSKRFIPFVI